jgi:hypothetical protein
MGCGGCSHVRQNADFRVNGHHQYRHTTIVTFLMVFFIQCTQNRGVDA